MNKDSDTIIFRCASGPYEIKAPKEYLDPFKSGGKEYHPDGPSCLVCPNGGEMIEIK